MRKTRAAFVTCGGDPFLSLVSLKLFKERFYDEIDRYYICYNADIDKKIVDFVSSRHNDPKVEFIYVDHGLGFGIPFNKCLEAGNEELILLLEDDGWSYKSGLLDSMFQKIEGGGVDAIGSPRFSCTDGIANKTREKYGLDYSGTGDKGPNFWPNFFFVKRADIMRTDLDFAGKGWAKGEYIKELDITVEDTECGDTFVWMCMQLRAMGLKFLDVGQRHAMPTEIEDIEKKAFNYEHGYFGWIHGGSLSSGWNGFLDGQFTADPVNEYAVMELESRAAFWTIAVNLEPYEEIKEFKDKYVDGIDKFVEHYKMDRGRIQKKVNIWKKLMKL